MPRTSAKKKTVTAKAAKPAKKTVKAIKKASGPDVGAKAPDFTMPATKLGEVSSKTLKGKPYVLYFYPKDDTSGCTAEACGFRDAIPSFGKLKATIIGVSKDNLASHEKFAKKYELTFPLGSDESGKVCASFGVWVQKSMYGRTYMGIERSTFVVDAGGTIRAVWRKVSVPGHVEEVRKALADL